MVRRESGLENQTWKASEPLLGLTDPEIVMIDCDNMPFRVVKKFALIVMDKYRLGGFIILRSSKNHYHVVFDRCVSWDDNMSAVGWFSVLSHNPKVKDYLVMQCIKKASTLRVVPTNEKPAPRLVDRFGCQDHAVKDFLRYRQLIKRIYRSLN